MTARAPILCNLLNNRTNHKILKRKSICILEHNIYKKYKHNIDILDILQPILDIQQQLQLQPQQQQLQLQPQPQLDIAEIPDIPDIPDILEILEIPEKQYKKDNIPKRIKELVWITYNGELFSKKCFVSWCNNITNVFNFHTGHDIPNSKGGSLNIENLKPICSNCNLSMGNKYTIKEWCKLLNN